MVQKIIDIGTAPNNGTGDPLRTAFTKCNENFTELYDVVLAPSEISNGASSVSIPEGDGNVVIRVNDIDSTIIAQDSIKVNGNANISGDVYSDNITISGNLSASGSISGDSASIVGNITAGNITSASNVYAIAYAGSTVSVTGNVVSNSVISSGNISAAGNIATGGFIYGDGGFISNVTVTSNVAVTRIANGNSIFEIAGTNGNAIFTVGGQANVLVATPNGALVTGIVSATGNITAGNLRTNGSLQAAGNITGGNVTATNLYSIGVVSAIGNIFASANVIATTFRGNVQGSTVSVTGNITASNLLLTGGIISSIGDITSGNLVSTGSISAAGNITASNLLLTGGIISSVGNITSGNLTSGNLISTGFISATGNITGSNLNVGTGTVGLGNVVNNNANGIGNIGSPSNYFNIVFARATSAQYADLAEYYIADNTYEPGTVVKFGGDFEITIADRDLDPEIAGVVSTNPAYAMNTGIEGVHTLAIALQGRVPCKVLGPVRKGQMMVSAGNGYARAENNPLMGTVIGKALEHFNGEQGIIEVVVGRV